MHKPSRLRSLVTHLAALVCGVVLATAFVAEAVPEPPSNSNRERFAALDSFAQSLAYISNYYVDGVDERALLYGGISGMVSQLDSHSAFFTPAQYRRLRQDTEGVFGGVGIKLGTGPKGYLHPIIEEVVAGSPASKAGLQVGDSLVEIAGKATVKEGKEVKGPNAWESTLRGAVGSRLRLVVARTSWKKPRTIELTRDRIVVPSVDVKLLERVGHVKVRRFQEATTRDLQRALERLLAKQACDALILDLRGNPGGLLDQGIAVADLFLAAGKIVSVVSRAGADLEVHNAHGPGTLREVPMVVLVDENTASAAEIVAAALQDHKRAAVIGVPSYGKGTVQTFLDLNDGSGIKLTTSRYLTPNGQSLEGKGVAPDRLVESFEGEVITAGKGNGPESAQPALDPALPAPVRGALTADRQLHSAFQLLTSRAGRPDRP